MSTPFEVLWNVQKVQQQQLGLDSELLNQLERRRLTDDLLMLAHEEAAELGRLAGGYKRHILRASEAAPGAIANECADLLKTVLALALTNGLSVEDLVQAFHDKTAAVAQKALAERLELTEHCRVICVDVDDVICDLEPWRTDLGALTPEQAAASHKLAATEAMKNRFYANGGFREMKPIEGAMMAFHHLKSLGWKIVLVTARPQWQYKRLYSDTVFWLAEHGFVYDLLLFSRNKVEAVYEHVRPAWPAYFVEDHPGNAAALAEAGIHVLLYDQPYNRNVSASGALTRVANWTEILSVIGV